MADRRYYQLPLLGYCGIEAEDGAVTRILLGPEAAGECCGVESAVILAAAEQLTEYAAGKRRVFELPIQPEGTDFQKRVWDILCRIPWGEARSYGDIAEQLGMKGGARAVGNAVGANPIPVLIPCHRVLAAGNGLGGFRIGADFKVKLLNLEHIVYSNKKKEKF